MGLTKKKALEICIELWAWLAETGLQKSGWPGWGKYGLMVADCPLCEYASNHPIYGEVCNCPLNPKGALGEMCNYTNYSRWEGARTWGDKKKYAKLFLEELKQLSPNWRVR